MAPEVADPYGGTPEQYEAMGRQVRDLLAGWSAAFRLLASERDAAP